MYNRNIKEKMLKSCYMNYRNDGKAMSSQRHAYLFRNRIDQKRKIFVLMACARAEK